MNHKVYYEVILEDILSVINPFIVLVYAVNIKEVYEIIIKEYPKYPILSVKLTDYKDILRASDEQSEKICKNCKWWYEYHGLPKFGDCYNPKLDYEGYDAQCSLDGIICFDRDTYPQSIEFGQNFGCIYWEER